MTVLVVVETKDGKLKKVSKEALTIGRKLIAVTTATTTGMKLRGRHSNSSNSTASRTAATGGGSRGAQLAVGPPAAPMQWMSKPATARPASS